MAKVASLYTPVELKKEIEFILSWIDKNKNEPNLLQKLKEQNVLNTYFFSLRSYKSNGTNYYKVSKIINRKDLSFSSSANGISIEAALENFLIDYTQKYDALYSDVLPQIKPTDTLLSACEKYASNHIALRDLVAASERGFLEKVGILRRKELKAFMNIPICSLRQGSLINLSDAILNLKNLNTQQPYAVETRKFLWNIIIKTYKQYAKLYGGTVSLSSIVKPPYTNTDKRRSLYKKHSVLSNVQMVIFEVVSKYLQTVETSHYYFPNGTYLVALLYLGLRKGELAGLTRADLKVSNEYSWQSGTLDINKQIKPLDKMLVTDENRLIFTKNGKPKRSTNLILTDSLKTASSKREIAVPENVMEIIHELCQKQEESPTYHNQNYFIFSGQEKKLKQFQPLGLDWYNYFSEESSVKKLLNERFYNPSRCGGTLDRIMYNCSLHPAFQTHNSLQIDASNSKRPYKFSVHDLRHTYISWKLRSGIAVEEVAKVVGHTSYNTTYDYYVQERDEIERLKNTPLITDKALSFKIRGQVITCYNPGITLQEKAEIQHGFDLLKSNQNFLIGSKTNGSRKGKRVFGYDITLLPASNYNINFSAYISRYEVNIYNIADIYRLYATLSSIDPKIDDMLKSLSKIYPYTGSEPLALSPEELVSRLRGSSNYNCYCSKDYYKLILHYISVMELLDNLEKGILPKIAKNGDILLYDGTIVNIHALGINTVHNLLNKLEEPFINLLMDDIVNLLEKIKDTIDLILYYPDGIF